MIYAYQLLARLRHLTLLGYQNGEYVFIGTLKQWQAIDDEEEKILAQKYA